MSVNKRLPVIFIIVLACAVLIAILVIKSLETESTNREYYAESGTNIRDREAIVVVGKSTLFGFRRIRFFMLVPGRFDDALKDLENEAWAMCPWLWNQRVPFYYVGPDKSINVRFFVSKDFSTSDLDVLNLIQTENFLAKPVGVGSKNSNELFKR